MKPRPKRHPRIARAVHAARIVLANFRVRHANRMLRWLAQDRAEMDRAERHYRESRAASLRTLYQLGECDIRPDIPVNAGGIRFHIPR